MKLENTNKTDENNHFNRSVKSLVRSELELAKQIDKIIKICRK